MQMQRLYDLYLLFIHGHNNRINDAAAAWGQGQGERKSYIYKCNECLGTPDIIYMQIIFYDPLLCCGWWCVGEESGARLIVEYDIAPYCCLAPDPNCWGLV